MGKGLIARIDPLRQWAVHHQTEVRTARQVFDAATPDDSPA